MRFIINQLLSLPKRIGTNISPLTKQHWKIFINWNAELLVLAGEKFTDVKDFVEWLQNDYGK